MERFTKVRNIGKGNMGACTLARNNEDGRHYVIKQVDLAKLNKKERQQSLNEAKLLSSLRHPNVINYVDSFLARKSDHLCIVMEFADGGDLSHKVKNAHGVNIPQEQILDWAIQVALALNHIHGKRILHRDVKTQNVFLTSDGLCKLGDFGIARTLNSTFDQAHTFVGTPYYLSPELILERPYDAMSDVWAFGVCLYETMALRHPFNANDMKSLMQRILKVQYDAPPTCYTPELRQIVSRLLVKDPAQRMKLTEMLETPIMVVRMKQWLQGGIVPGRYISSLIRHKLLPAVVAPAQPHPATDSKSLPSLPGQRQQRDPGADDVMHTSPAAQQRMQVKQEIRAEFRDVRLKPKPPPGGVAPMPQRDPSLLSADTSQHPAQPAPPKMPPRGALPSMGRGGQANPPPVIPRRTSEPFQAGQPRLAALPNRNPPAPHRGQPHHLPPVGNAPQSRW